MIEQVPQVDSEGRGPVLGQRLLGPLPAVLIGGGMVMIVLLHAVRPDVHPTRHYISEYGNDEWSWLLGLALVLIAIGLLALGTVLRSAMRRKLSPRLMQAAGLMLMVAAIFSTDRYGGEVEVGTTAGKLHGIMSIGAFCFLVLTMASLRGDASQRGRALALALPLAILGTAVAAAAFVLVPEADGLRQRAFLTIVFGWLVAAALELRHLQGEGQGPTGAQGASEHPRE